MESFLQSTVIYSVTTGGMLEKKTLRHVHGHQWHQRLQCFPSLEYMQAEGIAHLHLKPRSRQSCLPEIFKQGKLWVIQGLFVHSLQARLSFAQDS